MGTTTDAELLEAARGGDAGALEALIERYQPRVYRFGLKMCRDPEDAKDVLQDTLLAVARSLQDFRGASSISTWLYSITRSFCIKKRRRSKFAPERELSLEGTEASDARQVADPGRDPEETLEGRRIQAALDEAIGGLERDYREVLVLRDVEGLTAAETAEVTGLSAEAVKSRLHRARVALRERLAPLLGVPMPAAPAAPPCPDVLAALTRHLEGDLDAGSCAEMERHLKSCVRCRGLCDSLKETLRLCQRAPEPQVPAELRDAVRAGIRDLLARS